MEDNQSPQENNESSGEATVTDTASGSSPGSEAKAEEYLAGWKRAMADYANLKKESNRLKEETIKYATASFIRELLPISDHFKKALAQRPPTTEDPAVQKTTTSWIQGIEHIVAQFETVLKNAGVVAIDEIKVPFDPNKHEALMMEKSDGESGMVLQILEPGYRLHERILRPAKVVVAE